MHSVQLSSLITRHCSHTTDKPALTLPIKEAVNDRQTDDTKLVFTSLSTAERFIDSLFINESVNTLSVIF